MRSNKFTGKTFITNSSKETKQLGIEFANILEGGDVVTLYGDLGSGKTTFVQGLAEGLGIKNRIISPTFVIVRTYSLKKGNFYHIDLYRTENNEDIQGLGFEEIVAGKDNIVVIEWAEKLMNISPKKRIDIQFSYEKDDIRKVIFRSSNQ